MMERLRRPVELLRELSIPLIAGVVLAVVAANVAPEAYAALIHWSPFGHGSEVDLHFLVNDIFMALFFGIATKEITESCLPGGALNPPRKAVNPLLGTIGGVLGPIAVYFGWVAISGDPAIGRGWGIPTATDIALAWLVARQVFGKEHPAVSFLLLLAVADDGLGLGIIAIFYPDPAHPVEPVWLALVAAAMATAFALRRSGVKSFWPYVLAPGLMSWVGLFMAHLHPALAFVAIVPFMPSSGHDEGLFVEESDGHAHRDTLNAFEHAFKLPVDIGLFFFGLANAGVGFSAVGAATWGVMLALIIGKTTGVFTFSMVAHTFGYPLPDGMSPKTLLVAGMTAALGLTVALFVAGVAFTDPGLQGAAKMGALASVLVIPLIIITAKALRVGRFAPAPIAPGSRQIHFATVRPVADTTRPVSG
ncbi:MAG: Na+/H+ antiporter NhaA [Deltaproteobacteria bacterium]|nr:Na+/H+ antiporter NhaA [Deltaproteobacteria bacterium]